MVMTNGTKWGENCNRYCGMTQFVYIFTFLAFLLQCWLTVMHGIYAMHHASCMSLCNHSHSMLKFLLSFYYLQCLYLVAPRRQTNNQQLSWSLGWPGQCSLCPLQHMSQSFYLSMASLVQCPLSLFFVCILYFVICFQAVSQTSTNTLGAPWGRLNWS